MGDKMLNKEEKKEFKRLHGIFEHGNPLSFGPNDVLKYDELTRKLDYTDHEKLCRVCFN
jgi:hypothetical protein